MPSSAIAGLAGLQTAPDPRLGEAPVALDRAQGDVQGLRDLAVFQTPVQAEPQHLCLPRVLRTQLLDELQQLEVDRGSADRDSGERDSVRVAAAPRRRLP